MTVLALDTETARIEAGLLAPPLACVSWAQPGDRSGLDHVSEPKQTVFALKYCEPLVGANIAYDMAVLCEQYPHLRESVFKLYLEKRVIDVQLSEKLIDIARGQLGGYRAHTGTFRRKSYSLDALYQKYGGEPLDKDPEIRLGYGKLIDVPLEKWTPRQRDYAIGDAKATLHVYQAQREFEDYLADERNQPGPAFALHLMSCQGMRTDPVEVERVVAEVEAEIEAARVVCEKHGLVVKGKRKTMPAKLRLLNKYDELGFEVPLTDTGIEKADGAEVLRPKEIREAGLEKYVKVDDTATGASGDEVLKAYSTFGSAQTLRTKLETLRLGTKVPLQTRFDPLLNTGRTSSSAPGAPLVGLNIQNQDRSDRTRRCFIPTEGYYFCSIDFGMAELVCWAQVCLWSVGVSDLAATLNAGRDPHLAFACEYLLHIPYEEGVKRKKAGDPLVKLMRQISKGALFGLPGGLGEATFHKYLLASDGDGSIARLLASDPGMVKRARSAWFQLREAKLYFAWIKEQLGNGAGSAVQFMSGRIRGMCTFAGMANTFFQGLAADMGKASLLPIAYECYVDKGTPLYGCRPVGWIHDELLIEVPIDDAHNAAMRARELMLQYAKPFVPDVLLGAEPALMKRWSKLAEPAYLDGKLIPWEDAA